MAKWLLGICIAIMGASLVATDADAKRLGGGRSVGTQRNVTPPPAKAAPQAAPQQQTAPAAQQGSRWGMLGGILGGLALGGLLGYLFGGSGMMGFLLLALLAVVAFVGIRAFMRRRAEEPARPVQFAGGGQEMMRAEPAAPAALPMAATAASNVPAGFDSAGFLRAAKLNFIKLQVANDSGRLDDIREFTTREMFDELRSDSQAAGQQTDVVALNADLLELATEPDKHWASVRFSGMVRETPGTEPVGFEEVWNLVKPADGSSGWLLAGIQQMH
jgi:predicted lipid-binding transport protein (Tim44 family)